jgi:hypothetical protein
MAHFHARDGRRKNPLENGGAGGDGGDGKSGREKVPEWVRRLSGNEGLHVPSERLAGNAVHVEQFLRQQFLRVVRHPGKLKHETGNRKLES